MNQLSEKIIPVESKRSYLHIKVRQTKILGVKKDNPLYEWRDISKLDKDDLLRAMYISDYKKQLTRYISLCEEEKMVKLTYFPTFTSYARNADCPHCKKAIALRKLEGIKILNW